MTNLIEIAIDDRGVAFVSLNRPDKHNALSADMIIALHDAARVLGADKSVRVVVLQARGSSFCAGGDLGWMRAQIQADRETRRASARALADMLNALNTLPKPLIGSVQGNAFGGGVGLISVCDMTIAADHALFGLTETRLGLIPATISPYVLARMGENHARRVILSGRRFSAAEAVAMNLVATSVDAAALDDAVEAEILAHLAAAPDAIAAAKALARAQGPRIDAAVIDASIDQLVACWEGDEAAEGIAAFFEKRPPVWAHRKTN